MRVEKTQLVSDIGKLLNDSSFMYFVSYKGLSVKDFSEFRGALAQHDAKCHVLKNRLIKKAAELKGITALGNLKLREDTALITGKGDPGAVAKAIETFLKTHEALAPKGGLIEGELLSGSDVKAIASIPPREVLYAQLVGVIQAPTRNLVTVLNAKVASLVNVLNAYKNKLSENQ
ncbi:MAG: 50S ribosomal protein L10 [Lentisphaerae bacterium GWF2_44_16]|nr:MAG: 50S ribosomal protein L10 [Lentisphaerae bacterium GWF2_44_16]